MPRRTATALIVLALLGSIGVVGPASATDYAITAAPSASTVLVKRYVTIAGSMLSPQGNLAMPRKASIQQYRGGKWRTLKRAQIRADGSYSGRVRFKTRGVKALRVYKKRTSDSAAVASSTFSVTVVRRGTRIPPPSTITPVAPVVPAPTKLPTTPPPPSEVWRSLLATETVERADPSRGSISDAGAQYTNGGLTLRTLQADVSPGATLGHTISADWVLNRQCSLFTARIGLDDDTDLQSSLRVQVVLDGVVAFSQDLTLGQSVNLSLPVPNALRIRLQASNLTDLQATQYVNFGDAQVLCTP